MDFTDEVVGTRHAAPENIVRRACSTPPPPPPPPPSPLWKWQEISRHRVSNNFTHSPCAERPAINLSADDLSPPAFLFLHLLPPFFAQSVRGAQRHGDSSRARSTHFSATVVSATAPPAVINSKFWGWSIRRIGPPPPRSVFPPLSPCLHPREICRVANVRTLTSKSVRTPCTWQGWFSWMRSYKKKKYHH